MNRSGFFFSIQTSVNITLMCMQKELKSLNLVAIIEKPKGIPVNYLDSTLDIVRVNLWFTFCST